MNIHPGLPVAASLLLLLMSHSQADTPCPAENSPAESMALELQELDQLYNRKVRLKRHALAERKRSELRRIDARYRQLAHTAESAAERSALRARQEAERHAVHERYRILRRDAIRHGLLAEKQQRKQEIREKYRDNTAGQ